MPKPGTRQARGYGEPYQRKRRALLASNPPCCWCGAPATTADHYPPQEIVGPHLNLLPACGPCNFGKRALKAWKAAQRAAGAAPSRRW